MKALTREQRAEAVANMDHLIELELKKLETMRELRVALARQPLAGVDRAKNRADMDRQRTRYMAGELTHEGYYQFIAELIGADARLVPFSPERVAASTDPHLNDLPLATWDAADPAVRALAYDAGLAWSLSDTVCVLKFLARSTSAWERRNLEAKKP